MSINLNKADSHEVLESLRSGETMPSSGNMGTILKKLDLEDWPPNSITHLRNSLAKASSGNYKYDAMTSILIDEINRRRFEKEKEKNNRNFLLSLIVAIIFPCAALYLTYNLSVQETDFDQEWIKNQENKFNTLIKETKNLATLIQEQSKLTKTLILQEQKTYELIKKKLTPQSIKEK